MHFIWTVAVAVAAFGAPICVSAFPSSSRGFVTADVISRPADDLVKRSEASTTADDKTHYVRQALLSREDQASASSRYLDIPSWMSKYVKRGKDDLWVDSKIFDSSRILGMLEIPYWSADDAQADDAPASDPPADDAPVDDAPVDDAPADDAPTDDAPTDYAPTDDQSA